MLEKSPANGHVGVQVPTNSAASRPQSQADGPTPRTGTPASPTTSVSDTPYPFDESTDDDTNVESKLCLQNMLELYSYRQPQEGKL